MALAFAAADAAAPDAPIALDGDGTALAASVPAAPDPRPDGMGLALARRLIEEAGGTLAAATGAGTTSFTATLPAAARSLRSA